MELRTIGDKALMVIFENEISRKVNGKAKALKKIIDNLECKGIEETIMTYNAVTIYYNPEIILYPEIKDIVLNLKDKIICKNDESKKLLVIPVLYGGEYGADLEELAEYEGKSIEECIIKHKNIEGYIYMLGNMPGVAYIGSEEKVFSKPRKSSVMQNVPAGSVIVQKNQTIVLPNSQPTGWNIIGRSPLKIVDFNAENPFLLQPGMSVKFKSITPKEFKDIERKVADGTYELEMEGVR